MLINSKISLLAGASTAALVLWTVQALAQTAANASGEETVIVTGTRVQGMTAADSAAPLMVVGTDALKQGTGSVDLRADLAQWPHGLPQPICRPAIFCYASSTHSTAPFPRS